MKRTLIISVIALISACSAQQEKEQSLLSEVIQIHDLAMEEMEPVMSLKLELKESLDSTQLSQYQSAMAALDESHEEMMVWMRDFSQQFPDAALKGGGHHVGHENMAHDEHHHPSKTTHEEEALLTKQKTEMVNLRRKMKQAIENAQLLLNKDEL
ncbi:MAG: hypothetical protein AAFX87_15710 [Bacteroidota bacterium]